MPSDAERDAFAALQGGVRAQRGDAGHRWIAASQLHVTLRFLGDTTSPQREAVAHSLGQHAGESAPFTATTAGPQYWPSERNPRVLVLKLESGGALEALGTSLENHMRSLGFAPEPRAFRAHLTLARIRLPRAPAAPLPATGTLAPAIDHLALVRSTLRSAGSQYDVLGTWPLGGCPAAPRLGK